MEQSGRTMSLNAQNGGADARQNNRESQPPRPLTFDDMGDRVIPKRPPIRDTIIGKVRPCDDLKRKEKIYLLITVVAICTAIGFAIARLIMVQSTIKPDFVFNLVMILNAVFCVLYALDGVFRERPSELIIVSVATVIILVYIIVNYVDGIQEDLKTARLITGCLLSPVLVALGLFIAREYLLSNRLIFRSGTANTMLQNLWKRLLYFQDGLKLDLQLGTSMILLIIMPEHSRTTADIIITVVGGVVKIVWFTLGYFSFPKESKWCAIMFLVLSPFEIAYICYKIYDENDYRGITGGLAEVIITCGVLNILVRLAIIGGAVLVMRGFGKGLKELLKEGSNAYRSYTDDAPQPATLEIPHSEGIQHA